MKKRSMIRMNSIAQSYYFISCNINYGIQKGGLCVSWIQPLSILLICLGVCEQVEEEIIFKKVLASVWDAS